MSDVAQKFFLLDEKMEEAVRGRHSPCVVYLVIKDGITAKQNAIGYRQIEPERQAVSLHTWFDLASLTKVIFASVVMKFVENGEISLSEPIYRLMPEWANSVKSAITPWHLLTHTSGYPGQVRLFESSRTHDALIKAVINLPLRAPVGSRVEYSSQGFMVLEEWLKRKGLDWKQALFDQVLSPLDIDGIRFGPMSQDSNIAATEYCRWRDKMIIGEVHDENAVVLGGSCAHAGLFGTVSGVGKFAQAILDHYNGVQSSVWTRMGVQSMCKNSTQRLNRNRGLGWQIWEQVGSPGGDLMSELSFGHTGFTGTSVWIDPCQNIVAVLLTNRVHPNRDNESIFYLRQLFHNIVVSSLGRD